MGNSYFRSLTLFFIVGMSFIYVGCSNDIDINAPAKDIPVVFGLLSKADDVHYIRVERAFIELGTDALVLAQQEDQLYYGTDVTVSLKNLNTDEVFILDRVNAVDEGIIRDSGVFLEDPNILYSISAQELNLDATQEYQLIINRGGSLLPVTANANVVGDMVITRPIPNTGGMRNISITPNRTTLFSLREDPVNGSLYNISVTVNYLERTASDVNFVPKSIIWTPVNEAASAVGQSIFGLDFYSFLAGSLSNSEDNTTRRMSTLDIKFVAGGQALSDFQRVIQANAGISGAEDAVTNFTNLSEGRGLFSSRNILIEEGFQLTGESLDSLTTNSLTRDLNFIL